MGRDDALAAVTGALKDGPALVLIEGEAGIGKTRLVQEFLASPAAEPYRVLVAVCPPFRESLTLGPVVDAIRQSRAGVAGLELSSLAGALRPVFPEWAAELPPVPEPLDDAKASRHRLLSALADLIERLRVGLLVVEDVHWADEATLEFLLLLTSRQQPPSLVVTYRPEDVPDGSLLRRLSSRALAGVTQARLTLQPLDVAGTAGLVSSMLDGGPVSEEFTAFLHEHTDGLPLLVEESVRLLHDRADLIRRDGQWVRRSLDELHVPPTVRDAVLARLDRLSNAARRILDAVAVFAEPIDQAIVSQVAGLTADRARDGLIEALASRLVGEDGRHRVAFHHDLLGRAVYEAIPAPERWRLHLAAGNTLEATDPLPVIQLTRHYREANHVDKWCQYAEQAADRAVASNDHVVGVDLLTDVLSMHDLPSAVHVRLARRVGTAALFTQVAIGGRAHRVVHTLRTALDASSVSVQDEAELRLLLSRVLMQLGERAKGFAELERAIPHLSHNPVEAARAMISLGSPKTGSWPAAVHLRWLRRAGEIETASMSTADRLGLTGDRAFALLNLGEREGWDVAAELPAESEVSGFDERLQLARGKLSEGVGAVLWGRYAEGRALLNGALEMAETSQFDRLRDVILGNLAQLDWFTGAWEGLGERVAAVAAAQDLEPLAREDIDLVVGLLDAARGAQRKADENLRHLVDRARETGALKEVPAAALGRLRLAAGRVDDALQVTDDPMQAVVSKGIWMWATELAPVRVGALVAAGRVEEASRLTAGFARGLRGRNAAAPRAALATCRAILAEHQDEPARTAAAFARAAWAWERLPRPYDALLARERQAMRLLAADRIEAGLALLSNVYERLFDLGARGDADRVAHELREHGADVPRLWRGGRRGYGDQLSPRELEVVRLVVGGKTNREIAAALSKSPRTVGMQVRSAMRKLGASSRTALAVSAIQAGVDLNEPHLAPAKTEYG